jgi:hypothetical protein
MWRAKKQVNYKQFLWQIKEASSKKDFPLHPRPLFPKTHHFPRYQIAIAKLIYTAKGLPLLIHLQILQVFMQYKDTLDPIHLYDQLYHKFLFSFNDLAANSKTWEPQDQDNAKASKLQKPTRHSPLHNQLPCKKRLLKWNNSMSS